MSTEAAPVPAQTTVEETAPAVETQKETSSIVGSIKSAADKVEEELKKGGEEIKKGAKVVREDAKDTSAKINQGLERSNPFKKVGTWFKKLFN